MGKCANKRQKKKKKKESYPERLPLGSRTASVSPTTPEYFIWNVIDGRTSLSLMSAIVIGPALDERPKPEPSLLFFKKKIKIKNKKYFRRTK